MLQARLDTGYFTHQTRLSKVQRSRMTTSVMTGISNNSKASSMTLLSGYLLVRVGGGKQHGTGDSVLIGTDYVLLPGGTSVYR